MKKCVMKAVYKGKTLAQKEIEIGEGYSEFSIDIPFKDLPDFIDWNDAFIEIWNMVVLPGEHVDVNAKWSKDLPDGGKKAVCHAVFTPGPASPKVVVKRPRKPHKTKYI